MIFGETTGLLNKLNARDIIEYLIMDNVISFLESLGVTEIERYSDYLVCPTICHNPIEEATSMKLYWYQNRKVFHCYTECNESMSIYELFIRFMQLNEHEDISLEESIEYVRNFVAKELIIAAPRHKNNNKLIINRDKYRKKDFSSSLVEYNKNALDCFVPYDHPLWLEEGITHSAMRHFNIRFSFLQNKIVIPHYDINGRLIGIRGRALESADLEKGKYRPIIFGGQIYSHKIQFNLYGIHEHAAAIQKFRRVTIYEAEKSVMKDEGYFGKDSVAVACCGSNLNKFQMALLFQNFEISEVTVAFDKEYKNLQDEHAKKYYEKLREICKRYSHLAAMSFIFDFKGLLNEKDSPIDKGGEIYERLYKDRVKVKW